MNTLLEVGTFLIVLIGVELLCGFMAVGVLIVVAPGKFGSDPYLNAFGVFTGLIGFVVTCLIFAAGWIP